MPTELMERVLKLSIEEKLQLVEEIWESIAATQEDVSARLPVSRAGIRRAQALVRFYIPEGRRLSEELIEERRSAEGTAVREPRRDKQGER